MGNGNISGTNNWFGDLIMNFVPTGADIEGKTPESMIKSASNKAFTISTLLALPPGPLGMATIIPELVAVTKIQVNLIYAIAKYYGKETKLNATLLLLIFGNEAGVTIGKEFVNKIGTKYIVKARGMAIHPVICRNVISAFYHHSEELLVVTFSDGKVQLTSPTGMMGRVIINSGATDARFSGEDVVVYLKTGKAELRSQTGMVKKYL